MTDLYGEDVLTWSEHQAAMPRRRAAGELMNKAELDWPHLAEDIESLASPSAPGSGTTSPRSSSI